MILFLGGVNVSVNFFGCVNQTDWTVWSMMSSPLYLHSTIKEGEREE